MPMGSKILTSRGVAIGCWIRKFTFCVEFYIEKHEPQCKFVGFWLTIFCNCLFKTSFSFQQNLAIIILDRLPSSHQESCPYNSNFCSGNSVCYFSIVCMIIPVLYIEASRFDYGSTLHINVFSLWKLIFFSCYTIVYIHSLGYALMSTWYIIIIGIGYIFDMTDPDSD